MKATSRPNPPRTRARRIMRRRYRESGIDRYRIERYFAPIYDGVRTVSELRERFRQFVNDDSIWIALTQVKDTAECEQKALHNLDASVRRMVYGAAPKRKGKA